MPKQEKKKQKTSLVTCPGIVSYVNVWEARFDDNKVDKVTGEPVPIYSTMFLFDKSEKAFIKVMEAACKAAFDIGVKRGLFNARSFNALKKPLRDGDAEYDSGEKDDPIYKGKMFFNASTTKTRPDVKVAMNGEVIDIEDHAEFYSGCKARILINCYPYSAKGNKGIAAGLNGFLKLGDGDRLDGRPDVQSAFSEFANEGETNDEADVEDDFS